MASKTQNAIPFAKHPLAPLFFECVNMLKTHNFLKEAEDLIEISKNYELPENRCLATTLKTMDNQEKKDKLLSTISLHSPMSWAHTNLLGEYDFSDEKLKDTAGIRLPKIAT